MLERKTHIKGKGLSCPSCGSLSIKGGFIEIEEGKAFQNMCCIRCERQWQDVYQLIDVIDCSNPYSVKEVTNEVTPDQALSLAGM